MTDRPWLKFYPGDWRADEALRLCSLAARGLWIECLCLMHKAEPYGHLVVNGITPNERQLASLVGAAPDEVGAHLRELEEVGVFSRTSAGTIYSRRMTGDEKRRLDGKAAAHAGTLENSRRGRVAGETSLSSPGEPGQGLKDKEHSLGTLVENIEEKLPPPGVAERVEIKPPPHLETRDQIPEEKKESSSQSSELCPKRKRVRTPSDEGFDEFWGAYPTDALMPKKAAYEAWQKLSADDRLKATSSVPAFQAYCRANTDYRPVHAHRYLGQRRFDGFGEVQRKFAQEVFVSQGSPAWSAWQDFLKRTKGKGTPATYNREKGREGWMFPAEWPPSPQAQA